MSSNSEYQCKNLPVVLSARPPGISPGAAGWILDYTSSCISEGNKEATPINWWFITESRLVVVI